MIFNIQNSDQALAALLPRIEGCSSLIVFDLDLSMDPSIVPVTICQCRTCEVTVHLFLGEETTGVCPRCREETMEHKLSADLVLRGSEVLYADHRHNPGRYMP
jgi:hypothetical protein